MGLGDIVGKVISTYKADISDHKAKLKELTGAEKQHAQEVVASREKISKSIESGMMQYGLYAAAAASAFAIAKSGFEAYEKSVKLGAASASADIDRLKDASGGLKTTIELQEFAAAGLSGRFKLTSRELETVLKGMRGLELQGRESNKVWEAGLNAITKGEIEPLKELGVLYDETTAKGDKKRAMLDALAEAGKSAGAGLPTDEVRLLGVQFNDSFETIKISIGKVVTAMAPMVSQLGEVAGAIGFIAETASRIPGVGKSTGSLAISPSAFAFSLMGKAHSFVMDGLSGLAADGIGGSNPGAYEPIKSQLESGYVANYGGVGGEALAEQVRRAQRAASFGAFKKLFRNTNYTGEYAAAGSSYWSGLGQALKNINSGTGGEYNLNYASPVYDLNDIAGSSFGDGIDWERGMRANDAKLSKAKSIDASKLNFKGVKEAFAKFEANRRESFLTGMFGPVSEFDAYAEGFNLLKNASTSAFDAWVTGSASSGKAFKQMMADSIHAMGRSMFVQGLQESAKAIVSIATGDPAGAALHGKAGAALFAGAVVAGSVARNMGAGGGHSGGASVSSAGGYRAGASSGVSTGSSSVIIIGDVTSDNSPRRQARETRRLQELSTKYAPPVRGSY